MNKFFYTALFFTVLRLNGQVFIEHNIPGVLGTGNETEAEVIIHRIPLEEYGEYELTFQPGFAVKEIASGGGTFRSEDSRVRVIWSISPATPSISLRLGIVAGSSGIYQLEQRYSYQHNGERRTAYFQEFQVEVKSGYVPASEKTFSRLKQVIVDELPVTAVSGNTATSAEFPRSTAHVTQLRKDAAEALRVGESELKTAGEDLARAKKEQEEAENIGDPVKRSKALKEADIKIQKAEINWQIATKIVALAKTLQENADAIETAASEAGSDRDSIAVASVAGADAGAEEGKQAGSNKISGEILYRIQIGAFAHKPGRSEFDKLGMVQVVNEDGLYKVLFGSFASRTEAADNVLSLSSNGIDGFVVKYLDGQRVR